MMDTVSNAAVSESIQTVPDIDDASKSALVNGGLITDIDPTQKNPGVSARNHIKLI